MVNGKRLFVTPQNLHVLPAHIVIVPGIKIIDLTITLVPQIRKANLQ